MITKVGIQKLSLIFNTSIILIFILSIIPKTNVSNGCTLQRQNSKKYRKIVYKFKCLGIFKNDNN